MGTEIGARNPKSEVRNPKNAVLVYAYNSMPLPTELEKADEFSLFSAHFFISQRDTNLSAQGYRASDYPG
jgi:hypothetical protein